MKKWITYARTVWHEFWMYMLVGAPRKEEGLAPRSYEPVEPYWTLLVANNINRIHDALGTEVVPETEEEARALYMRWCEVTDVPAPDPALPKVITQVNTGTETARLMTEWFNRSANLVPTIDFGGMLVKFDKKKLWVYNVSRVDHKVDNPMLGKVTIPANTTKKRYSMWTSFPEVVMGLNWSPYDNELYPCHYSGEDFVKDLINPDYIKGGGLPTSIGRDLSVKGVFWSYNNPPKAAEVNSAIQKMRSRYADLLDRIVIVWESVQINGEWVDKYMNCLLYTSPSPRDCS